MGTRVRGEVGVDLMFLLAQASHVLMTELTAALEELGVSQRHYCVLCKALEGGELTQIRLAELCGMDKTTMVVTLDELERAGLAERRPSATDRRARIVAVTAAGAKTVRDGRKLVDRIYADVLDTLPARERDGFVGGLTRLVGDRLSTPVQCDRPVRRRI
ncbi:MAG TPA: MarR family transcriptional regulator [Actinophytocola sp.]|uniref:MarR family winged helix-turn-helix transcriptional regulator n=1 Tax=Actinophytocola sp. TaxID=1872138 RepID=UPI002DB9BEAE|nr:MarR family transcriptional regulator [Actinophytocola sp.]HEU5472413.1 MarR family transcriptional regulator [Actinophytocola sp.]